LSQPDAIRGRIEVAADPESSIRITVSFPD
jgi:hypothetical protein